MCKAERVSERDSNRNKALVPLKRLWPPGTDRVFLLLKRMWFVCRDINMWIKPIFRITTWALRLCVCTNWLASTSCQVDHPTKTTNTTPSKDKGRRRFQKRRRGRALRRDGVLQRPTPAVTAIPFSWSSKWECGGWNGHRFLSGDKLVWKCEPEEDLRRDWWRCGLAWAAEDPELHLHLDTGLLHHVCAFILPSRS